MTKGQKIKESFGESWNLLTYSMQHHILTTHHWVDRSQNRMNLSPKDLGFDEETECEVHCEFWRPIQLKGIENNNGWIKIENKTDLPKEDNSDGFWVISEDHSFILNCYFDAYLNNFIIIHQKEPIKKVTHYQKIMKPKPPIY